MKAIKATRCVEHLVAEKSEFPLTGEIVRSVHTVAYLPCLGFWES